MKKRIFSLQILQWNKNFVCGNNGFSGFTIKMLKQDGQNIGNYRWTVEEVKTGKNNWKRNYFRGGYRNKII